MNANLLRELITFGALGSLAERLTHKKADELVSPETLAQIDAIIDGHTYDELTSTLELLALLDESAARIIALNTEGGGSDREETDGTTTA